MDPLEFLFLSPFIDDNNSIVIFIFFLLIDTIVSDYYTRRQRREWWKFPRSLHNWRVMHEIVWHCTPEIRNERWHEEYRMSWASFNILCDLLRPYVQKQFTHYRDPIEVERVVAIVLKRLAFGYSNTHIANLYGTGSSTVWKYTKLITDALSSKNKLFSQFISIPSGPRLINIIRKFKNITGISQMCGAIDGTHIRLRDKPKLAFVPADYWNRHDHHSVLLQAVCDSDLNFWDVAVLAPGGTHDATHLRASSLYRGFMNRDILQEPRVIINNETVLPYIVGDSAYPPLINLMKAYSARESGNIQRDAFDKALRRGRVKIENSFAQLKNRWRVLKDLNFTVPYAAQVILACCVLHNFCQLHNERLVDGDNDIDDHPNLNDLRVPRVVRRVTESASKATSFRIRGALYSGWVSNIVT